MRFLILTLIVFSSVAAIDLTYESDIRCPISDHWCFILAYYEDGWLFDEFLGRTNIICSKTTRAAVSFQIDLREPEIDGWYDPYAYFKHNCSMHDDTLHWYTMPLPSIPTDLDEDYSNFQVIYLNDQGQRDESQKFHVNPEDVTWA